MPEPSHLPSFNSLASQISGEQVEPGREDRFLGKLERERKTDVHAAASRLLYGDHTSPTLLHREILRLFGESSKVRVVTTNFDDHFSAAAKELFRKDTLLEFCSPALPQGDSFSGLIYLHGSARIAPQQLVLTDRNFGSAYLTRGWARDFLVSLFSRFTVLFVGFSHNDVTTTYLARGLEPSSIGQRWAMVPSNATLADRENWQHLDISVIEYPIDPNEAENCHKALTGFFTQWSNHRKETIFTRAKRVKTIARGLPPESDVDSAYLHYCLSNPQLAYEFCKGIRHASWVGWMHDRGYFDSFFSDRISNAKPVESRNVLTRWLCTDVRRRFPSVLLNMIRTHRQCLNREFSRTLAHLLWSDHREKPDPNFATWVSVLLSQGKDAVEGDIWAYLLGECRPPDHLGIALGILDLLSTPAISIKKGWEWSSDTPDADDATRSRKAKVDFTISWPHESRHSLREAWAKVFEPHLPVVANPLSQIVVKQLTHAYLLLRGVGKTCGHFDELSRNRSSIAPHEQDDTRLDGCLSCLIDILRRILDYWIETEPLRARLESDLWWSTNLPLMMRFAAYARSRDPQYTPDERIKWVLANRLVFRSGMKKEVFDILASAYPAASHRARKALLRYIDRWRGEAGERNLSSDILAYERFNVSTWLRRSDPDCPLVQSAISKIQSAYPHFVEGNHPEFEVWHGKAEFVDPTEGFDLTQILSRPPEHFVEELLQARHDAFKRDLRGHIQCLPKLFKDNKKWGKGFVEALSQKAIANEEIWNGVFRAWRDTIEIGSDWCWILGVLEELPREPVVYAGIANLISHGFGRYHDKWDDSTVDRSASLMDQAWQLCKSDNERADDSYGDWLTTAVNHVGGWIGEFWVHNCSHLRQRSGEDWQGIPKSLMSMIKEALEGTNRVGIYARIALTPWIGFFFKWDREFAIEHLLQLFDWNRDPVVAQQSWSVLLDYKRGASKELEWQLIPFYLQCAERSDQFGDETLHHLGHQLAAVAIHVIPDPVASGFFRDFLPRLSEKVRGALANGIGTEMEGLSETQRRKLWDTWLRVYLDLRLLGVPVALSTSETKYMLEWCLNLGSVFSEAVERIARMPQESVFAYDVANKLANSPLVDASPLAACRLVNSALSAEDFPHLHNSLVLLHEKFKNSIRREPEFTKYEELLFLRGWTKP